MAQEVLTREETIDLLTQETIGHLATFDATGYPYIVPLNYVYYQGKIYFHCAHEGRKLDNLTANNRGSEAVDDVLNKSAEEAQNIKNALISAIDADTDAFNAYMEARRLPSKTPEEKQIKHEAEQNGLKEAILIPLKTAQYSLDAIKIAGTVIEHGNPNSISDVGVGAQVAFAGVKGGIYNVLINLKDIEDFDFVDEMKSKCLVLKAEAKQGLAKVNKKIEEKLNT